MCCDLELHSCSLIVWKIPAWSCRFLPREAVEGNFWSGCYVWLREHLGRDGVSTCSTYIPDLGCVSRRAVQTRLVRLSAFLSHDWTQSLCCNKPQMVKCTSSALLPALNSVKQYIYTVHVPSWWIRSCRDFLVPGCADEKLNGRSPRKALAYWSVRHMGVSVETEKIKYLLFEMWWDEVNLRFAITAVESTVGDIFWSSKTHPMWYCRRLKRFLILQL